MKSAGVVRVEAIKLGIETMAAYGLPHADSVEYFDVGTGKYLSYFEKEILDDLVSKGGATCRFFEGAYGAGKTHLLQMLTKMGLRKGMVVAQIDLSQAIGLEDWGLITKYILKNMTAVINGFRVRSLPDILFALGDTGNIDLNNLNNTNLPHSGFRNAMIQALRAPTNLEEQAWLKLRQFLMGERVGLPELKRLGLFGIRGNLTSKNAELVLKTVLKGLYLIGLPGTMILFDENEKTLVTNKLIPPRKIKVGANLIRRLIDGCTTGVMVGAVVIFAVLPGFLENCSMVYPALHQRLNIVERRNRPAWRWPLVPVNLTSTIGEPEDFLEQAIKMFEEVITLCGGNIVELRPELQTIGQSVLENNAGLGYKRDLMKQLAIAVTRRL